MQKTNWLTMVAAFCFPFVTYAATATSVSQWGITWTFSQPHEVGQFVNGDWWVLGPVTISSVAPAWDGNKHGTMVDPVPSSQQGYRQGLDLGYNEALRAVFPLTLSGRHSVISTIGLDAVNPGGSHEGLKTAAILTVVDSVPPATAFRPAYINCTKKFYTTGQIKYDLLPALPLPASAVIPSTTEMQRVWLDHAGTRGNAGATLHPVDNMEPYYFGIPAATQALLCFLDVPERNTYLVRYLQWGIDLYPMSLVNGDVWIAYGGFGKSRKWPILFAGLMFDDENMQHPPDTTFFNNNPAAPVRKFSEDGHTWYGQPTVSYPHGKPLWGLDCAAIWAGTHYGTYCAGDTENVNASGNKDCRDPAGTYDNCSGYLAINSSTYPGEALAAHLMGASTLWGWDAFFDYTDRYVTRTDLTVDYLYGNSFINKMWAAYRNQAPIPVPEIMPAGGIFDNYVQVTLRPWLHGITLRYTMNGIDPDAQSPVYTNAFTLLTNTVVKVRAYKTGAAPGPVVTAVFTVHPDVLPPSISVIRPSENPTRITVVFTEPVDAATAANPANYTLDHGATVSAATVEANGTSVTLTTSALTDRQTYILSVSTVKDQFNNTIAAGAHQSFVYSSFDPWTGLTGYWNFNTDSGATATDRSGRNNHGAITGARLAPGYLGQGLAFAGSGDIVDLGNNDFNIPQTNAFTLAFWIKVTAHNGSNENIFFRSSVAPWLINTTDTRHIRTIVRTDIANTSYQTSNSALTDSVWHHVALTFTDGSRIMYLDGIADVSNTLNGNAEIPTYEKTYLGNGFTGLLDEVRIYNRALTADKVQRLYADTTVVAVRTIPRISTVSTVQLLGPNPGINLNMLMANPGLYRIFDLHGRSVQADQMRQSGIYYVTLKTQNVLRPIIILNR